MQEEMRPCVPCTDIMDYIYRVLSDLKQHPNHSAPSLSDYDEAAAEILGLPAHAKTYAAELAAACADDWPIERVLDLLNGKLGKEEDASCIR
jgi:hypothetical protein